ncbi:hypothetical protein MTR_3g086370 [Medicago truncatula]|uniref:Uncharacterized protein n=1 Tax=Medicago truncatula TaxID=3880 RepID=G7J2M1_MEDTR|nr:hypothetical protein MTR_3g086370 [Medicago truncatula]
MFAPWTLLSGMFAGARGCTRDSIRFGNNYDHSGDGTKSALNISGMIANNPIDKVRFHVSGLNDPWRMSGRVMQDHKPKYYCCYYFKLDFMSAGSLWSI